jgi:hypothetical protein
MHEFSDREPYAMSRVLFLGENAERNGVFTHRSRQPSGRLHLTDEIEPPIIREDVSTG